MKSRVSRDVSQPPDAESLEFTAKRDRLLELLRSYGSCAVAFSGGSDSTVVAKAAHLALGDRAAAITGVSGSMAAGELEAAEHVAQHIGIHHVAVSTDELANPKYLANRSDRCYHCKNELIARVEQAARRLGLAVVADGGNRDDLDDYRPGRRAVCERGVRSPLAECGLTKAEVRQLAALWALPVCDKPATPCLSSRIAYGEPITHERLEMVDRAEQFLRKRGFRPLRVRYHRGDMARIEIIDDQASPFYDASFRREVIEHFKSLGFKYVSIDLEGFRSGSMNAMLAPGGSRL